MTNNIIHSEQLIGNLAGREYVKKLDSATKYIRSKVQDFPDTLLILGSGIGGLIDALDVKITIPYCDIPYMPQSTTAGHAGNLIIGTLGKKEVAVFNGRVHCHDGLRCSEVAFGARVMACLNIKNVIVTNASASLNPTISIGDIIAITNHISLFLPEDPSFGLEHPKLGDKFYPQTDPYDEGLRKLFFKTVSKLGFSDQCFEGIYCFVSGPRYESRGDIDLLRALNVIDAVGMSTVPEVLALKQMLGDKVRILGISTITNKAAGLGDSNPNHEEVKQVANEALPRLQAIIAEILSNL